MIHSSSPLTRALLTSFAGASLFLTTGCDSAPADPFAAANEAAETGDFQAARVFLQQALEQDPANAQAIMLYGKTQLALENPEGAAEEFKKLLGNAEFSAEAGDLLAKSYVQMGNAKLALSTIAEQGQNSGLAYAVQVVAHVSDGDVEQALVALDQGLAKFPDSLDLLVLDAKRSYDRRQIDQARTTLTRILKERPMMTEALLLAGRLEMQERNWDAAKGHFAEVSRTNPWNLPAVLSMAAIARDQGDPEGAGEWLRKASDIAPGHPISMYFAAQTAYDSGDIDTAHKLVQSLGAQETEFPALRLLRGLISAQQGQNYTAISELERFFRLGGDNSTARIALAGEYAKANSDQKAWDILQPVLGRASATAPVLNLAAKVAGKLGLPEQAQLANRAREAGSADRFAKDLVQASAAIKQGKWADADRIYGKVMAAGGDGNAVILNNAANIRLNVGDKAGAVTLARKAIALAPNDPVIMDTLGWSLVQLDNASTEGRSLIESARRLAPDNREIAAHWEAIS